MNQKWSVLATILQLALATCIQASENLRVATFNIQVFGKTKWSKQDVGMILINIALRYDVMAIQEVRDKDETAVGAMVEKLNEVAKEKGLNRRYGYFIGERIGRSQSKEQYGFIFDESRAQVVSQYQDTSESFERPPLFAEFKLAGTVIDSVIVGNLHTRPDDVKNELEALYDSYETAKEIWPNTEFILLGDWNADCNYLSPTEVQNLRLRKSPEFKWLVTRSQTTTAMKSRCLYDHIVLAGEKLVKEGVVKGSTRVFSFAKAFNLDQETAYKVSDHMPVEFEIAAKESYDSGVDTSEIKSYIVRQILYVNKDEFHKAAKEYRGTNCGNFETEIYTTRSSAYFYATLGSETIPNIEEEMKNFMESCPQIVHPDSVKRLIRRLRSPATVCEIFGSQNYPSIDSETSSYQPPCEDAGPDYTPSSAESPAAFEMFVECHSKKSLCNIGLKTLR